MAIFVHILLTLGFGVAGLIFMGGFWGAVFGLVFGLMEAAILCSHQREDGKTDEIWGSENSETSIIVLLGFPALLCGILLGKIIGGFGWVMLGLLIGVLFGGIVWSIYIVGKLFAALFLLFVPAGIVIGIVFPFLDIRWLSGLLGAVAGGLASFLLSAPHTFWLKYKRKRKLLEEEAEKKRLEEYERNRPITEKLAEEENMAIFLLILIMTACGILSGIFLGGFWWVVFGILFGVMESVILLGDKLKFWDDEDNAFAFVGICSIVVGIAGGKIIGGFWWVFLSFIIGFLSGVIIMLAYKKAGKMLAALLPILMPTGAILALNYIDKHWFFALLGVLAGSIASIILSLPHMIWRKIQLEKQKQQRKEERRIKRKLQKEEREKRKKEEEEKRRIEEEIKKQKEEEERQRQEEIERNRPIEEKLAELEAKEQKNIEKNKVKMNKANQIFSQLKAQERKLPDKLYKDYIGVKGGDDVFNSNFTEDISGLGVGFAKARYEKLLNIAQYYAAWCNVEAAKTKNENDRYTHNKKKAVLLATRLKDIWDKLTEKQKERKINDTATEQNVNLDMIVVNDTLQYFDISPIAFDTGGITYAASTNFSELWDDLKGIANSSYSGPSEVKSLAVIGLTGLAVAKTLGTLLMAGFGYLKERYEQSQDLKREIENEVNYLHKKIISMKGKRLKMEAFSLRAAELNMSLEKAINVYEKHFFEVYSMLFPAGDTSKSKDTRNENKLNGGNYFNDDEAEKVVQLRTTGQFLLKLVDIPC